MRLAQSLMPLIVSVGVLLFASARTWGHGQTVPQPTESEMAQVEEPLVGSEEFARRLVRHLGDGLPNPQVESLQSVGQMLTYLEESAGGQQDGVEPEAARFYRWRMETHLIGLLEGLPDLIVMDFTGGKPEHDPDTPIELDRQQNLLLLKTVTGNGPVRFVVQETDLLSEQGKGLALYQGWNKQLVRIAENATTYSLLLLNQVPAGRTIVHLAFQNEGAAEPHLWHAITLATRPNGNFALAIRDELGQPTPVMLRLTSQEGNRLYEPADALDLRPQMNAVTGLDYYGPGRGYQMHMPGSFAGHYWYVRGDFEMALPPGDWEVRVFHGLEYEPVLGSFTVMEGKTTRKRIDLVRHTDMAARGWFSGDDHTHARLMSSEDGRNLVTMARAADIRVCNVLEMGDWMRSYYPQRGFGPEFRVHEKGYWIVPGQEDPRSMLGHAIGLNLTERVRDLHRYLLNDWWAEQIHRQGGLYGHTHVGQRACLVEREMALFTPMGIVDFNSVVQRDLGTDYFYDFLNLGFRMTATAGEDMPYVGVLGASRVYAYCGTNQPFHPDLWFQALRRGQTFVTTGPMLEFEVDGAKPGDELVVGGDRPLLARARAWGAEGQSAPRRLRIIRFGDPLAETRAEDQGTGAPLSLETTVPAGDGGWLVAHAEGANGSEALTSPVYIMKPGLRFWDITQAGRLIQKQLTRLEEIELALQECETAIEEGTKPLDYWTRWGAEQAPEVRVRIERAREIYRELQVTLQRERALRRK